MKSLQGRGNSDYKGPEAGVEGVCARNSKEASEAKHTEQEEGRRWGQRWRGSWIRRGPVSPWKDSGSHLGDGEPVQGSEQRIYVT